MFPRNYTLFFFKIMLLKKKEHHNTIVFYELVCEAATNLPWYHSINCTMKLLFTSLKAISI